MENIHKKIIERYKKETLKECYEIVLSEGIEPSISDNKLGGTPYFPEGENYPYTSSGSPMALLLQVNLKDIDLPAFPSQGILEIFIDACLDYPLEYKVFIFEEGLPQTTNLPEPDLEQFVLSHPFKIELKKSFSHMPLNDYRADNVIRQIAYMETGIENFIDGIWDNNIYRDLDVYLPGACLGGYADFTQEDPRSEEDNRDFCLFKLDSLLHKSIYIGDSGILSAIISEDSLRIGKVEDAVVDWDCC